MVPRARGFKKKKNPGGAVGTRENRLLFCVDKYSELTWASGMLTAKKAPGLSRAAAKQWRWPTCGRTTRTRLARELRQALARPVHHGHLALLFTSVVVVNVTCTGSFYGDRKVLVQRRLVDGRAFFGTRRRHRFRVLRQFSCGRILVSCRKAATILEFDTFWHSIKYSRDIAVHVSSVETIRTEVKHKTNATVLPGPFPHNRNGW